MTRHRALRSCSTSKFRPLGLYPKVNTKDFGEMQDKVVKLELSVRDNRTILGDGNNGGGGEINTLVKRIILNMEDGGAQLPAHLQDSRSEQLCVKALAGASLRSMPV